MTTGYAVILIDDSEDESAEFQARDYWFRALTKYEKRVDFKAIQGIFDEDALTVDGQIRAELRKIRDSLLKKIEEADNGARLTPEFISGLKLDTNQEVGRILGDYLLDVWRNGRDLAFKELPGTIKVKVEPVKQFELMYAFCPTGEGGGIDPTCSPQEGGGTAGGEDFNIIDMKLKPLKAKWPPKTNFGDYLVLELKNGDRIQGWIDDDKDGDFLKSKSGKIVRVKKEDIIAGIKLSRSRPDYSLKRGYQTGLEPIDALNYFRTRALILAGIIDDDLLKQAKFELLEHIKGGRPLIETIGNLRSVFEPWVGDPTKIGPSGQVGIGFPPGTMASENILMAYRLETIIRTETTGAMNQGRLAIADASGDYTQGMSVSAILDARTTETCRAADGLTFRKEDAAAVRLTPPLHYQCRSILTFVTTDDLPVEWSSQAEIDKVVRLISPDFK